MENPQNDNLQGIFSIRYSNGDWLYYCREKVRDTDQVRGMCKDLANRLFRETGRMVEAMATVENWTNYSAKPVKVGPYMSK